LRFFLEREGAILNRGHYKKAPVWALFYCDTKNYPGLKTCTVGVIPAMI
jgi:hypothetical protein